MIYGRILLPLIYAALLLLVGSSAADWLEGGNVGSIDRNEILPYFSDPIFYMPIPSYSQSYPYRSQYYNYSRPVIQLGKYPYSRYWGTYPGGEYPLSEEPRSSEFRQSSLASMQWTPFQKNWTEAVSYAKTSSSLRVFQGGEWKTAL